jgi:hypothetical protein
MITAVTSAGEARGGGGVDGYSANVRSEPHHHQPTSLGERQHRISLPGSDLRALACGTQISICPIPLLHWSRTYHSRLQTPLVDGRKRPSRGSTQAHPFDIPPVGVTLNVKHTMGRLCYKCFAGGARSTTDACTPGVSSMKKSDLTCPECGAGYRRIELISMPGTRGEFRCLVCDHLLETYDGSRNVALRLTVQPERPK